MYKFYNLCAVLMKFLLYLYKEPLTGLFFVCGIWGHAYIYLKKSSICKFG